MLSKRSSLRRCNRTRIVRSLLNAQARSFGMIPLFPAHVVGWVFLCVSEPALASYDSIEWESQESYPRIENVRCDGLEVRCISRDNR
jgi:hypothetical protein